MGSTLAARGAGKVARKTIEVKLPKLLQTLRLSSLALPSFRCNARAPARAVVAAHAKMAAALGHAPPPVYAPPTAIVWR